MILYNPTVSGSLLVTGSLTTTGTLTAQTLVVQTITSSVDFVTGSSVNGSLSSNTHQFTGSVLMSSSLTVGGVLAGTSATFSGDVSVNSTNSKTGGTAWNLNVRDNTTMAANVGGGISFQGLYTTGGGVGNFGAISAYKTNATSGNESGGLKFYYSTNGIITQGLQISETGAATFSGNVGIGGGTPSIFTAYSIASFGSLSTTTNGITIASTTTGNGLIEFADGTTSNQAYRGYIQYAHTSDSLILGTAGSDRVTITSAGNVGIGTTSPDALLTVAGANQSLGGAFNTYGNALIYSTDSYAINKGGSLSFGGKYNASGTPIETFARIHGKKESATDGATSGYLAFETTNDATALLTERMRITSTGNVGIGTTTPTAILDVDGAASSTISALTIRQGSGATAYGQIVVKDDRFHGLILRGIPASTANLSVTAGDQMSFYEYGADFRFYKKQDAVLTLQVKFLEGTIYASNTTVQSISDIRTKENITNSEQGLDVITALRPVRFDFKEEFNQGKKNQLGFIAQEIEEVFPDAVGEWKDDNDEINYKTVGPGALIPVLVKAIQELKAEIDTLKQQQ